MSAASIINELLGNRWAVALSILLFNGSVVTNAIVIVIKYQANQVDKLGVRYFDDKEVTLHKVSAALH